MAENPNRLQNVQTEGAIQVPLLNKTQEEAQQISRGVFILITIA